MFRTTLSKRAAATYPEEVHHALRSYPRAVCCLRRDMSGSALPNRLSADNTTRLARRSLALRPASLLPTPWWAFVTPLRMGDFAPIPEPATWRIGAYQDGTCTR